MIVPCKKKDKRDSDDVYCLYSKDGDKLLGRGKTKGDMMEREKQVQFFKHKGEIIDLVLKEAMDFPTQEAMEKYLKDHPDADKSKHHVVETKPKTGPKKESPFHKFDDVKAPPGMEYIGSNHEHFPTQHLLYDKAKNKLIFYNIKSKEWSESSPELITNDQHWAYDEIQKLKK